MDERLGVLKGLQGLGPVGAAAGVVADPDAALAALRSLATGYLGWRAQQPPFREVTMEDMASGGPFGTGGLGGLFRSAPFSKVMEGGLPKRVYHGTPVPFQEWDPKKLDPGALFGPGFYFTENPMIAGGATKKVSVQREFPTREAAEAAPGRNYFVWQEGPVWKTTVTDEALERRGYAHGVPNTPIPPEDRQAIVRGVVRDLLGRGPGYLTSSETENVNRWLAAFAGRGPFGGNLGWLEGALHQQPYNLNPLRVAKEAGVAFNAPNVRPAYLDITNPFNLDAVLSDDVARKLAQIIQPRDASARLEILRRLRGLDPGWRNEEMYRTLAELVGGRDKANVVLRRAGFDGITHWGGSRTGNDPHRVWIAFKPKQIHSAFTPLEQLR